MSRKQGIALTFFLPLYLFTPASTQQGSVVFWRNLGTGAMLCGAPNLPPAREAAALGDCSSLRNHCFSRQGLGLGKQQVEPVPCPAPREPTGGSLIWKETQMSEAATCV